MLLAATIVLVLLTSVSASLGNTLFKAGSSGAEGGEGQGRGIRHLPRTLRQPAILSGMAVYAVSQLLWISVLRLMDLSLAYPLQIGINFTLIMLVAWFYFKEPVSRGKLVGIGMIFAGIVIIAVS